MRSFFQIRKTAPVCWTAGPGLPMGGRASHVWYALWEPQATLQYLQWDRCQCKRDLWRALRGCRENASLGAHQVTCAQHGVPRCQHGDSSTFTGGRRGPGLRAQTKEQGHWAQVLDLPHNYPWEFPHPLWACFLSPKMDRMSYFLELCCRFTKFMYINHRKHCPAHDKCPTIWEIIYVFIKDRGG